MSRPLTAARFVTITAAAVIVAANCTSAVDAHGAVPHRSAAKQALTGYSLSVSSSVVSSTHKKLILRIDSEAEQALPGLSTNGHTPNASKITKSVSVELSTRTRNEGHVWTADIKGSQLKVNPKTGGGKLASKSSLGKYGQLTLKVSSAGKLTKQHPCSSLTYTDRPVTVSGSVRFNTRSGKQGWGVAGSKHFTAHGYVSGDYGQYKNGCSAPFKEHCARAVQASVYTYAGQKDDAAIDLSAGTQGKQSSAYLYRTVSLSNKISRSDSATVPIQSLAITPAGSGTHTLTVAGAGKGISGTGILTATEDPTTSKPSYCKNNVTQTSYDATYTNGAKPLTVALAIEDPITIDTTSSQGISASFDTIE